MIPDANFEQSLINEGYDVAPVHGSVTTSSIDIVNILEVLSSNIADLTRIEDFTALTTLSCFDK